MFRQVEGSDKRGIERKTDKVITTGCILYKMTGLAKGMLLPSKQKIEDSGANTISCASPLSKNT